MLVTETRMSATIVLLVAGVAFVAVRQRTTARRVTLPSQERHLRNGEILPPSLDSESQVEPPIPPERAEKEQPSPTEGSETEALRDTSEATDEIPHTAGTSLDRKIDSVLAGPVSDWLGIARPEIIDALAGTSRPSRPLLEAWLAAGIVVTIKLTRRGSGAHVAVYVLGKDQDPRRLAFDLHWIDLPEAVRARFIRYGENEFAVEWAPPWSDDPAREGSS